jgi:hypothetical protein
MIEKYIDAHEMEEEDILQISTFRQMLEVCKRFKKVILKEREMTRIAREEAIYGGNGPSSARGRGRGDSAAAIEGKFDDYDPKAAVVGELESFGGRGGGFSLGNASSDSRPLAGVEGMGKYELSSKGPGSISVGGGGGGGLKSPKASQQAKTASPSRADSKSSAVDFEADSKLFGESRRGNSSLDLFIANEGRALHEAYINAKALIKESKHKIKESTTAVNDSKLDIDRLQAAIENRKAYRISLLKKSGLKLSDMEDIVDEEEFQLMKDLREAKRLYKNAFETLQSSKHSSSFIQNRVEEAKANLGRAFSDWESNNQSKESNMEYEDPLDDQEAFDKLELDNIMQQDPDSLAFFNAQKTQRALITQVGGSIKQTQKTKRFG